MVDPRQGINIVGVLRAVIQVAVHFVEVAANIATLLGSDLVLLGFDPLDALAARTEPGVPRVGSVDLEHVTAGDFRFGGVLGADAGDVHPVLVPLDFFHE